MRYAGQPPRCYRCGSEEHQIRNCPKPQSYRRCYVCGSGDHLYQQCPRYTADSFSSGHPEPTDQPSCLPVSVLGGLSVASGEEAVSQDNEDNEIQASADDAYHTNVSTGNQNNGTETAKTGDGEDEYVDCQITTVIATETDTSEEMTTDSTRSKRGRPTTPPLTRRQEKRARKLAKKDVPSTAVR